MSDFLIGHVEFPAGPTHFQLDAPVVEWYNMTLPTLWRGFDTVLGLLSLIGFPLWRKSRPVHSFLSIVHEGGTFFSR